MKLVQASAEQKRARDVLTHAEWGKALTVPQYQQREERLRAHPYSLHQMQTWLWMDGDQVLASCETFRMQSFVRGEEGHAYGVASVYTEPSLRGRGHATKMMNALQTALAAQDPRVQASILFSDVGAELYERSGYQARPGEDRWLAAEDHESRAEPFREEQVASELARVRRPDEPFLIWPSAEQLDWHLERERIYSEALSRPRPFAAGARAGESRIFWAGSYASKLLAVLLLDARSAEETRELLREAQHAAMSAGLERVLLWESSAFGDWRTAVQAIPPAKREGYLPMVRPFVAHVSAEAWNVIPRALWI